jgi:hypothetical protein
MAKNIPHQLSDQFCDRQDTIIDKLNSFLRRDPYHRDSHFPSMCASRTDFVELIDLNLYEIFAKIFNFVCESFRKYLCIDELSE